MVPKTSTVFAASATPMGDILTERQAHGRGVRWVGWCPWFPKPQPYLLPLFTNCQELKFSETYTTACSK
jgi:hypothetical protein